MERWPDFFVAGAPKAGTTALHAALRDASGVALSRVKEPKFFLCDGSPPSRRGHRGPGDAHSRREWVWSRSAYLDLWSGSPDGALRGESTPFYLFDRDAHRRIARVAPEAKFIVLLRDPVDRAYSNWMHLWSDGLEPESDFLAAVDAEDRRTGAGWAPFWRYRDLGRYGEQLHHLLQHFDRRQVLAIRYRDLVDEPASTVDRVLQFLGLPAIGAADVPRDNTRPFRPDTPRTRGVAQVVRAGAWAGSFAPPQAWRRASRPLLWELHRKGVERPRLTPAQRRHVLEPLLPDIELLEKVTGQSFDDWRVGLGRGSFASRSSVRVGAPARPAGPGQRLSSTAR